jgi:hypothetical protein
MVPSRLTHDISPLLFEQIALQLQAG